MSFCRCLVRLENALAPYVDSGLQVRVPDPSG